MAGRPRKPTNVLRINGTANNHPERLKKRENEPKNTHPIGTAPRYLSKAEKAAFRLIVKESLAGVLGRADRIAVAQASILLALCTGQSYSAGFGVEGAKDYIAPLRVWPKIAERNLLYKYLSQFGMTPADRSKLDIPSMKEKNEFDVD